MRPLLACLILLLVGTSCSPTSNRELGHRMVLSRGLSETDWKCFEWVIDHESMFVDNARGSRGDYGIPQAFPGSKMATVAADWRTNPATQIEWGIRYMLGRYHSLCGAKAARARQGWY